MRHVPPLLRCTALAGSLAAAAAGVGASEPGTGSGTTPIRLLVASLESASDLERIDFAYIALDEMGLAYRDAAESAMRDARALTIGGSQARWIQATLAYAARLEAQADDIDRVTLVEVVATAPGPPVLLVDEVPVVVSGPRIGEPGRLHQRVVARHCAAWPCRWAESEAATSSAAGDAPARLGITWTFDRGGGSVCASEDGLSLVFRTTRALDAKRITCSRVVTELRLLADALDLHRARGGRVAWGSLEVLPLGPNLPEHVRLDRDGHYLLMDLPTLARVPEVTRRALPWLKDRDRNRGEVQALAIADAERLLADVLEAR